MPRNNQHVIQEAAAALDRFKYEVANQAGVPLQQGYNGNLTTRQAGKIGGQMVKRMIAVAEQSLSGGAGVSAQQNLSGGAGVSTQQNLAGGTGTTTQ